MTPVNLAIAGSRTLKQGTLSEQMLIELAKKLVDKYGVTHIVSGCCYGADKLGELFAHNHNLKVIQCPANCGSYGNSAGPIRNRYMANIADVVLVVHTNHSRGSLNMISQAKLYGKPTYALNTSTNILSEYNTDDAS